MRQRGLAIVLAMIFVVAYLGSGLSAAAADGKKLTAGKLVDAGEASLLLFKTYRTDTLRALGGDATDFKAEEGNVYWDIVLKVRNDDTKEVSFEKLVPGGECSLEPEDGAKISKAVALVEDIAVAAEKAGGKTAGKTTSDAAGETAGGDTAGRTVSTSDKLEPQKFYTVHIGFEVPETVKAGTARIKVGGAFFTVALDAENEVSCGTPISMDDEVDTDGIGVFRITESLFSKEVLTPYTRSNVGSRFALEDADDDIFFVVSAELTNESPETLDEEKEQILSVVAMFDGKRYYTIGRCAVNDAGDNFESGIKIEPKETKRILYVFEIPEEVMSKAEVLEIFFAGNEFEFSLE